MTDTCTLIRIPSEPQLVSLYYCLIFIIFSSTGDLVLSWCSELRLTSRQNESISSIRKYFGQIFKALGRGLVEFVSLKETTIYLWREDWFFQSLQKRLNARVNIHSEFLLGHSPIPLQAELHSGLVLLELRKTTLSAISFWVTSHCTGPISAILRFCHMSIMTSLWQCSCNNSAKARTIWWTHTSCEYTIRILAGVWCTAGWERGHFLPVPVKKKKNPHR